MPQIRIILGSNFLIVNRLGDPDIYISQENELPDKSHFSLASQDDRGTFRTFLLSSLRLIVSGPKSLTLSHAGRNFVGVHAYGTACKFSLSLLKGVAAGQVLAGTSCEDANAVLCDNWLTTNSNYKLTMEQLPEDKQRNYCYTLANMQTTQFLL